MSESVRIAQMPPEAFGALLRSIGPEVGRLALRGDKLARRVVMYFQYAHAHPTDLKAVQAVREAVEDYMNRDLRVGEQYELGSRFGHRLPEPEKPTGPRVFVPESVVKQ